LLIGLDSLARQIAKNAILIPSRRRTGILDQPQYRCLADAKEPGRREWHRRATLQPCNLH
jgi:hypothetical protein